MNSKQQKVVSVFTASSDWRNTILQDGDSFWRADASLAERSGRTTFATNSGEPFRSGTILPDSSGYIFSGAILSFHRKCILLLRHDLSMLMDSLNISWTFRISEDFRDSYYSSMTSWILKWDILNTGFSIKRDILNTPISQVGIKKSCFPTSKTSGNTSSADILHQ